jgi:hypothetical protein
VTFLIDLESTISFPVVTGPGEKHNLPPDKCTLDLIERGRVFHSASFEDWGVSAHICIVHAMLWVQLELCNRCYLTFHVKNSGLNFD